MTGLRETRHATTVAIGGHAVLIEGPSGSGKSDLALRLIDRGAVLVSDDYTDLAVIDGTLVASAPATIAGRMEVRGIGIVPVAHLPSAPVAMLVSLADREPRLPDPATCDVLGMAMPHHVLCPFPASAAIKLEWALQQVTS